MRGFPSHGLRMREKWLDFYAICRTRMRAAAIAEERRLDGNTTAAHTSPHGGARTPWPADDTARVPFWVYCDPELYAREQARIFTGPNWNYVALEAEVPNPGDFKRSFVGDKPVIVTRGSD